MNAAHQAGRQSRRRRSLAAAVAVVAGAAIPAGADYQFIVSGYPAANESYPAAFAPTSLVTATRSGKSVSSALEARCRTWDESNATSLRSDKYEGAFAIIIRKRRHFQNFQSKQPNQRNWTMNKTNSIAFCATLATAVAAHSAVPVVTPVSMTQADNRVVTITYTLSDAPAVITLDVQTNANTSAAANDPGWTSIGGEAIWNAEGDVWKEVAAGSRTITWRPDHSWPDHVIESGGARAVVTAWALENTPDYMVVDLAAANTVRYYPGVDYLPKSGFDQPGAAVTNNPAYKTTKLLMRKIMASGIEWTMGSADGETQRNANETPHVATLANNYYIGVFEVTQAQWANINPGSSATASNVGETRPMDNLCYNEIRNDSGTSHASHSAYDWPNDPHPSSYLGLLRAKTGLDFDLPSEAQWEFAARSGNGSGHWNDGSAVLNTDADANLGNLGCYNANTPGGTAVVGSYSPSALGLYDMHGNVFEWCLDWYEDDISGNGGSANIDPSNSTKTLSGATKTGEWDMLRVFRGGAYGSAAKGCRAAYRGSNPEWFRQPTYGFRVVCTAGLR